MVYLLIGRLQLCVFLLQWSEECRKYSGEARKKGQHNCRGRGTCNKKKGSQQSPESLCFSALSIKLCFNLPSFYTVLELIKTRSVAYQNFWCGKNRNNMIWWMITMITTHTYSIHTHIHTLNKTQRKTIFVVVIVSPLFSVLSLTCPFHRRRHFIL